MKIIIGKQIDRYQVVEKLDSWSVDFPGLIEGWDYGYSDSNNDPKNLDGLFVSPEGQVMVGVAK